MSKEPKGFIRMTNQRRVILDVLRSTTCHPTADWIYERVREQLPNVSLGTVYSNLRRLTEMGEIMELNFGSSYSRFDGNACNHYHFTCDTCGNVLDLPIPVQQQIEENVKKAGFRVTHHRLEFYGTCPECQGKTVQ